jgi:hypothetical protein
MIDPDLTPDLAALERRLAARPRVDPPPNLGPRVLAASRAVLRPPAIRWRTGLAWAAAVLVGINLSMSVAADTDWQLRPEAEPEQLAALTDRLRALAPDLPEAELRRQALLARAAADLTPTAHLTPNWERVRTAKELD